MVNGNWRPSPARPAMPTQEHPDSLSLRRSRSGIAPQRVDRSASPVTLRAPRESVRTGGGAAFGSLLAFTVVLFIAPQNFIPIPALGKLTAGLAIGSHVVIQIARNERLWRNSMPLAIAGALLVWTVATIPFSLYRGGSVEILLDQFLKSLAVFWLLSSVVDRPTRLHILLWALSLMSVPIALTAITNYVTLTGSSRIIGYSSPLAENPNALAMVLNTLLPIAAGLMAAARRAVHRFILLAIIVLDAAAIMLSFSRAGFLALVCTVGLSIYAFVPRRKRIMTLACTAAVIVAVVLWLPSYQTRVGTIWNIDADSTNSAQARSHLNRSALAVIADKPILGSGLGNDVLALNEFGNRWQNVHNIFLQYAVDLGLPGFVLFVWLFAECLRCLTRARRTLADVPSSSGLASSAKGIWISLVGFAVSASFAPGAYHFYFYYPAGLALAVDHAVSTVAGRTTGPRRVPTPVL